LTIDNQALDALARHFVEARSNYSTFVAEVTPNYIGGWFQRELCATLQRFVEACEAKQSPRLIIEVPFRHGKTLHVGERLIPWALGRNPESNVIYGSYGQDLSDRTSKRARAIIGGAEYGMIFPELTISEDTRSAKEWQVLSTNSEGGGSLKATSVGGAVTGFGADLFLVLDDLIKDQEAAESATIREKTWEWTTSTALSRVEEGAGVLINMTRWHQDDPVGRVVERLDGWERLTFPALAIENEQHRAIGEALSPGIMSKNEIERKRSELGDFWFSALMQQQPLQRGNQPFKREYWQERYHSYNYDEIPHKLALYQDAAYRTGKHNDSTVTLIGGCDAAANRRLFYSDKRKCEPGDRLDMTMDLMKLWKPRGCNVAYIDATDDAIVALRERMKRDNFFFIVEKIKYGGRSKDSRIEGIDGYRDVLWFNDDSRWLVNDLCSWYRGKDREDDGPDILATFCEKATFNRNQREQKPKRPRPKRPRGGMEAQLWDAMYKKKAATW